MPTILSDNMRRQLPRSRVRLHLRPVGGVMNLARCPDCHAVLVSEEETRVLRCDRCSHMAGAKLIAWLFLSWALVAVVFVWRLAPRLAGWLGY